MLSNTAPFNKEELSVNFGESSVQHLSSDWNSIGVRVDSRQIVKDNLFVALKGETTDGHNFVNMAFELGAAAAVVDKHWYRDYKNEYSGKMLIPVSDTKKALGKLGNINRRRFNIPIIAIGGANGKTTTKDMTSSVLSKKLKVLKTYKNYNNQIGLPFMLLQLNTEYDIAVLEIGTNEPGEIAILTAILEPTHGLITNIGKEHLEKLVDLDGVEMEETFLFGFLHKTDGFSFINMDDLRLKKYQTILENNISFGTSENEIDISADIILNEELNPIITFKAGDRNFKVNMRTIGFASGLNAVAAGAVSFHAGLSDEEIKKGLESYEPEKGNGYGRMLIENISNILVINDCYNANPDSMYMALNTLNATKTSGKKISVLGDMLELGESAPVEHFEIVKKAADISDLLFVFGKEMNSAVNKFEGKDKIFAYMSKDDLFKDFLTIVNEGDTVLVKGSRGMAMEKIISELKQQIK